MAAKVDLALGVLKEREANLKPKPITKPPKTLSFIVNLDTTINTYKVQTIDTYMETKNHNTINFKKFSFKNLVL